MCTSDFWVLTRRKLRRQVKRCAFDWKWWYEPFMVDMFNRWSVREFGFFSVVNVKHWLLCCLVEPIVSNYGPWKKDSIVWSINVAVQNGSRPSIQETVIFSIESLVIWMVRPETEVDIVLGKEKNRLACTTISLLPPISFSIIWWLDWSMAGRLNWLFAYMIRIKKVFRNFCEAQHAER